MNLHKKSVTILVLSNIYFGLFFFTGCSAPNKRIKKAIKINTIPTDALISVHETSNVSSSGSRKIAGTTPVEKIFEFKLFFTQVSILYWFSI